jgi:hypothetical protein
MIDILKHCTKNAGKLTDKYIKKKQYLATRSFSALRAQLINFETLSIFKAYINYYPSILFKGRCKARTW